MPFRPGAVRALALASRPRLAPAGALGAATLACLLLAVVVLAAPATRQAPAAWALAALFCVAALVAAWRVQASRRAALQRERLRAMGQLAGAIAHDFNNALSPIVGFTELLLRNPELPPETAQRYVQRINTAAQETAAVVRRLREIYGERRTGRPDEPVDVQACVLAVVDEARSRWTEAGAPIRVQIDVGGAPVVHADAAAVRQMLADLVTNAVEAMPQGGTLTVRARPDGDGVRVEIADTGVGMSDDVRERCLDPFFSTKGVRGTGLGLPLVHATVTRHAGTLDIRSAPGRGSTVLVRLPARRRRSADPA